MQDPILQKISVSHQKKRPRFSVGDKVSVHVRLKEGDKERIQLFKGVVISKTPKSGLGVNAMFTVRKISEGVGVERIFPVHSPFIEKIEIEATSFVRRSRLYYLRALKGKKARLNKEERFIELAVPDEEPVVAAAAEAEPAKTETPAKSE